MSVKPDSAFRYDGRLASSELAESPVASGQARRLSYRLVDRISNQVRVNV